MSEVSNFGNVVSRQPDRGKYIARRFDNNACVEKFDGTTRCKVIWSIERTILL